MSNLIPISREQMRQLKNQQDEKNRLEKERRRLQEIDKITNDIYSSVTYSAKTMTETSYRYPIVKYSEKQFLLDTNNMNDVIKGLQVAFPDCSVKYVEYGRGFDGKLHDMQDIYATCSQLALSQLDRRSLELYIIIDWS